MAMFSLQSSDTQQVSRRIMRRPYMFLNRRARRLERKIGRTMAAGAAGGVAGAAGASASTKKTGSTKQTGNTHTRANHNPSASGGGSSNPPALSDKMNQKDSSKSEVHSSSASQTQEMQSTSKRGIVDKKSVSKQPQSENRIRSVRLWIRHRTSRNQRIRSDKAADQRQKELPRCMSDQPQHLFLQNQIQKPQLQNRSRMSKSVLPQ